MAVPRLLMPHLEDLRKSGLTDETIQKYNFSSVLQEEATKILGFTAPSAGWIIKYPNSHFLKFKPDKPCNPENKYLSPRHMAQDLFITYLAEENHDNTSVAYYFCEGEKKCCALEQEGYASIGVPGVWGFRSQGHLTESLTQLNLKDRLCYIIFDADKYSNKHVLLAEKRLAEALVSLQAKIKIVNLDKIFGKGADDQLLRLGKDFQYYIDNADDYKPGLKDTPLLQPPTELSEFIKKPIPKVEYYAEGFLQKLGRTMISSQTNTGKSITAQNLAIKLATGETMFLDKFALSQARVLYLDLEMGEPALKQRFETMLNNASLYPQNLYVKFLPGIDLFDEQCQLWLEKQLSDLEIQVLIIDPLSNCWTGDENNKQEVQHLLSYLDRLIYQFKLSILIIHHWRKAQKGLRSGGEMAAGSYAFSKWLDHHITLQGDINRVAVSCEKNRNGEKFKSFWMKLNSETLWLENIGDIPGRPEKHDPEKLKVAFDSFNEKIVAKEDLIKRAKDKVDIGKTIVSELLASSTEFYVGKLKKEFKTGKLKKTGKRLFVSRDPAFLEIEAETEAGVEEDELF